MPQAITVTFRVRAPLDKTVGLALRAARQRMNQRAAEMMAAATRSNFGPVDNGYRPFSWEPYKRNYRASRIPYANKRKGGPATLVRTGVLQRSIKATSTPQWGQVSAEGARNYARAHQFGNPGRGLPARPYFPVYQTPSGFVLVPRLEREIVSELGCVAESFVNR